MSQRKSFAGRLGVPCGLWGVAAVLAVALMPVLASAQQDQAQPTPALEGMALVEALQQGGYVLFLRHTSTHHDQEDLDRVNLDDCSKQRNLSEQGKQEAAALGKAFAALGVPVGPVLSSPYCRCVDTATLAFGRADKTPDLTYAIGVTPEQREALAGALRTLLATPPPTGRNTVLASHTANVKEAAGVWPDTEGEILAFQPGGPGEFSYVGRMTLAQWAALAAGPPSQ